MAALSLAYQRDWPSYTQNVQDERLVPGMPELHRQPVRPPKRGQDPPARVPETRRTPLERHYITLSAIALVCGVVATSALELGMPPGALLVKLCVIVGAPLLFVTMADAALRIWRSAWAWMPVDRARGVFRLTWGGAVAILYVLYVLLASATYRVVTA
jgi:hypothetical protein